MNPQNISPVSVGRRRLAIAFIPVLTLLAGITLVVCFCGVDAVSTFGPLSLLVAALVGVVVARLHRRTPLRDFVSGLSKSASQMFSAIPILLSIGFIATTWMLGGIVPVMIDYGLILLDADWFLPVACMVCAVVSVVLGSSWTTIATLGVALMGVGGAMGYSEGLIAGAIISGAYFGDKVSPLSDTTVIASSTCGVNLFTHIRNLLATSLPAMLCALVIFAILGMNQQAHYVSHAGEIEAGLAQVFNLSPWLLLAPVVTIVLCLLRIGSLPVLLISGAIGLVAMFVAQPHIVGLLIGDWAVADTLHLIFLSSDISTGSAVLDSLVSTSGVAGMLPTVFLIISAAIFGGVLIGSGMLADITGALIAHLHSRRSMVPATTGTGLLLNSLTGDQYLSIIIGGNMYGEAYRRSGLEPKLLSRTLEDSISVTSVLIPWNSCGLTQSTVLGVATLTYMPFCFFNYLSPLFTILWAVVPSFIRSRNILGLGRASA